jgi:type I restriction enzyme, S subunit
MRFGLDENILEKITQVFEANSKVDKALMFGSRAKGNWRPDSDIDIAIMGKGITLDDILKMSVAFESNGLSYKIDLLDYNNIKEKALVEHIDRVGIAFYDKWKEYKLIDLVEVIGGGTPKTSVPEYWGGDIPWLSVTDFNTSKKYCFNAEKKITKKGLNESSTKILRKGQIIISARGTVGVIAMLGKDMAFNQSNYGLDAKKNLTTNEFLYYLLKANLSSFISAAYGAVFDTITKETFHQITVLLPPLKEQSEIDSILSGLDDKIDLLHRQNKTLEQLTETLFRKWFVEESDNSWEEKKLGELVTITSSKRIYYSEYVSSGIPFYRSKEIIELRKNGSTNSELFISNDRFEEINIKFGSPKEGDILMTSVGTIGIAYRVRNHDKFYFKDGNLTWFKDFRGLPSSILYLWLISKIGQEELEAIKIGSTQEALTIEGLKSISFKIPPKAKINEYELEFNLIIKKTEFNQTQIRTLAKLRDILLPKLMSGEVRVKL